MQYTHLLRYTLVFLLGLAFVSPLLVTESMFFPYITGKNFFFRIVVEIALGVWCLLALLDRSFLPRRSPVLISIAAFLAIMALANLLGMDPSRSFWSNFERMEGYLGLLHLGAFAFLLASVLADARVRSLYLHLTLGVSVVVALIGLGELGEYLRGETSSPRIDATLGNAIYLAAYALFHIFFSALLFVREERLSLLALAYGAVATLNAMILLLTLTRGTLLGLFAGGVLCALLIALFEKERLFLRRMAFGVLALSLLSVGAFFALRASESARENPFLARFANVSLEDKTVAARFLVWGMALEGVRERPLLGWGQEHFSYVFDRYYDKRMYDQEQWFDRTHNVVLDWLIAGGTLGLLGHLAMFGALLYMIWCRRGSRREEGEAPEEFSVSERAVLAGLLTAYFVHNLFVFDNLTSALLFFFVLALVHARTTPVRPFAAGLSSHAVFSTAAPMVLVCVGLGVYALNVPYIAANKTLIRALVVSPQTGFDERNVEAFEKLADHRGLGRQETVEHMAQAGAEETYMQALTPELRTRFYTAADKAIDALVHERPENMRLLFLSAPYFLARGDVARAEAQLALLVARVPEKPQFRFAYANILLARGDREGALEQLRAVHEMLPEYDEARVLLAALLIREGGEEEARALLAERPDASWVDDERIADAYRSVGNSDALLALFAARVAAHPEDGQAYASLASAYLEAGMPDEAVAVLEDLKAVLPGAARQVDAWIADIEAGRTPGAKGTSSEQ